MFNLDIIGTSILFMRLMEQCSIKVMSESCRIYKFKRNYFKDVDVGMEIRRRR